MASSSGGVVAVQDGPSPVALAVVRRIKGTSPGSSTVRSKLQRHRSVISGKIAQELRLRAGAENLIRATANEEVREQVKAELKLFNSHLDDYRQKLTEINSAVKEYQGDTDQTASPLIPLPLKDTKDLSFTKPFQRYLKDHYYEDPADFKDEIDQLDELRKAIQTPSRSEEGIKLLCEYYNQLCFIDKRFFPTDRSIGVYFTWHDALTGAAAIQRTIGFEKGSILFNLAALLSQIACRQNRTSAEGLLRAAGQLERGTGALKMLQRHFSDAPTLDMRPHALSLLTRLLAAESRECRLEAALRRCETFSAAQWRAMAHAASHLSSEYTTIVQGMREASLSPHLPPAWQELAGIKALHYRAASHSSAAHALVLTHESGDMPSCRELLTFVLPSDICPSPETPVSHKLVCRTALSLLRAALLTHEEALRHLRAAVALSVGQGLKNLLKLAHDRTLQMFTSLEQEDEFFDYLPLNDIPGKEESRIPTTLEDLSVQVEDIFHRLGPVSIFSARHEWSSPKKLKLTKGAGGGYGFSVRGDSPAIISVVDPGGVAETHGMRAGDFIVAIGATDTRGAKHSDVVALVRSCGDDAPLPITVVTPRGRNYLSPRSVPPSPVTGSPPQDAMQGYTASLARADKGRRKERKSSTNSNRSWFGKSKAEGGKRRSNASSIKRK